MDFQRRLAAHGYYVPSMITNVLHVEASPSQNRACAIHAHGSSSLLSLRCEQVHLYHRSRQRKLSKEPLELFHGHAPSLSSTVKPLREKSANFVDISPNSPRVVCHTIIRDMPSYLGSNSLHQLEDRSRSIRLQPLLNPTTQLLVNVLK